MWSSPEQDLIGMIANLKKTLISTIISVLVQKISKSFIFLLFAIVIFLSDCDTETETIYSAQSTDTIAANDKIADDDEVESEEEEEDVNEYEPESCEEEERPPQVAHDSVEKPRPSRLTKINMKG